MIMENVLNTQNIVLGRQENFIRRLKEATWSYFALSQGGFSLLMATTKSGSEKSKIQHFLLFLSFLGIDALLDPNFFRV